MRGEHTGTSWHSNWGGGGGHVLAGTSGVAFGGPGCILGFAKGMRGEHLTQYAKEVKS